MSLVYVLAVIGYSSIGSKIVYTEELSWHLSLTECHYVLSQEVSNGRGKYQNENFTCLPVVDHVKRRAAQKAARHDYPIRHGTRKIMRSW